MERKRAIDTGVRIINRLSKSAFEYWVYKRRKSLSNSPAFVELSSLVNPRVIIEATPMVETIIEPVEDTIGLVCIGQEVTDELDYTPAKLHINRTIRPKYITKENEPLFAVHRLYVFSEIYQQIDESPIKVQDRR